MQTHHRRYFPWRKSQLPRKGNLCHLHCELTKLCFARRTIKCWHPYVTRVRWEFSGNLFGGLQKQMAWHAPSLSGQDRGTLWHLPICSQKIQGHRCYLAQTLSCILGSCTTWWEDTSTKKVLEQFPFYYKYWLIILLGLLIPHSFLFSDQRSFLYFLENCNVSWLQFTISFKWLKEWMNK